MTKLLQFTILSLLTVVALAPQNAEAAIIITTSAMRDDISSGLVGHWTFDGKDCGATYCVDKSTGGNTGTFVGNVHSVTGKLGQAMYFDGIDDGVLIGTSPAIDAGDFTLSAWIKTRSTASAGGVITNDSNGNGIISLRVVSGNAFGQVRTISNTGLTSITGTKVNDGNWHQIALTKSGTSVVLYRDGVSDGSGTTVAGDLQASDWYLGIRDGLAHDFEGVIDDARIYDRALSGAEIATLYKYGGTPNATLNSTTRPDPISTSGLVGHWTFDASSIFGSKALDSSGTGNTATTSGISLVAGKIGQALGFNLTTPPPTTSGLVAWWSMDTNTISSEAISDLSGSGKTATLVGNHTHPDGKIGQAIDFTDANTYASFSDTGFPTGTANRSLTAWIKTSTAANQEFFTYGATVDTGKTWYAYVYNLGSGCNGNPDTGGQYALLVGTGGANSNVCDQTSLIDGSWHFIAVSATGATQSLYVDGVFKVSGVPSPVDGNNTILSSGKIGNNAGTSFVGSIDDMRFYNRALSANEITTLYNNKPASVALSPSPLSTSIDTFSTMSVGTWVRYASSTGTQILMRKADTTTDDNSYVLKSNGTNFQFIVGTGSATTITGSTVIVPNKWYHVMGVADGSNMYLYVDGAQEATSAKTGTITTGTSNNWGQSLFFGSNDAPINFLIGTLDDPRIYSRALSATEVAKLYTQGKARVQINSTDHINKTLTSGLVGHWTFDGKDCGATYCIDKSGSGNTGTSTSKQATVGKIGQAWAFDGSADSPMFVAHDSSLALTTAGTVSIWAKSSGLQETLAGLVSKNSGTGAANGSYFMYWYNNTNVNFIVSNGASFYNAAYDFSPIANTGWNHFVGTWDGINVRLYINGKELASTPAAVSAQSLDIRLKIGGATFDDGDTTSEFSGSLDDARIYNRALSAAEIAELYKLGR